MKILVCLKQIAHICARTGTDETANFLSPEDLIYRINPYDEAAMELACRLKARRPGTRIAAVTFGAMIAKTALKNCTAMGADQVIHISEPLSGKAASGEAPLSDPWQKSGFLAQAARALEPDLILCGKESIDTQNGQVGAFMAHHLNLPFICAIRELAVTGREAVVQRNGGKGIKEEMTCPLPAVFSVDMAQTLPHLPTFHEKKEAGRMNIDPFPVQEGLCPLVSSQRKRFPVPFPRPVPPIDPQQDAFNRISLLLSGSRMEKKGTRLTGSSRELAQGIVSFLEENGFLKSLLEQSEP